MGFVQNRLTKLDQYYDKVIGSEVYLKVEKTSSRENKSVEIKMHIPKDELVVKKNASHSKKLSKSPTFHTCAESNERPKIVT